MAVAMFGGGDGSGVGMGVGTGVGVCHCSRRWWVRNGSWIEGRVRLICAGVGVALSRLLYRMVGS